MNILRNSGENGLNPEEVHSLKELEKYRGLKKNRSQGYLDLMERLGQMMTGIEEHPMFRRKLESELRKFPRACLNMKHLLNGTKPEQLMAISLLNGKIELEEYLELQMILEGKDIADEEFLLTKSGIHLEHMNRVIQANLDYCKGNIGKGMDEGKTREFRLSLSILTEAVETALSWETGSGLKIVKMLSKQGIPELDVCIAQLAGFKKLTGLKHMMLTYLNRCHPRVVANSVLALARMRVPELLDKVEPLLESMNTELRDAAIFYLEQIDTGLSMRSLFFSAVVTAILKLDDGEFLDSKETDALAEIVEKLEWKDENYWGWKTLFLILEMVMEKQRSNGPSRFHLRQIEERMNELNDYLRKRDLHPFLDMEVYHRIRLRNVSPRIVADMLQWIVQDGFARDLTALFAVTMLLIIDPRRFTKDNKDAVSVLSRIQSILENLKDVSEHTLSLVSQALLMIEGKERWVSGVMDQYRKNDWHECPILKKTGYKILSRYGKKCRLDVLTLWLRYSTESRKERQMVAGMLMDLSPKRAIELYEEGLFELDPVEAALLYGKIGDTRGYAIILENITLIGRPAIRYLARFGDSDALPVLRSLQKMVPASILKRAIEKIENRKSR